MTEYLHKVNGFGFTIEEYQTQDGTQAHRIKATVLEPSAYYHCGYTNYHDAEIVLGRLIDRFEMQHYRVNFNLSNPVKVRDNLAK